MRQRKALLVTFTTELTEMFMRSTMYYNQNMKGKISYSALYEATDSGMLAKLAEVIKDHEIINTIVQLKGRYFQIQRHVLEASKFAAEQTVRRANWEYIKQRAGEGALPTIEAEKELHEASARAHSAQSRALAFFEFEEMLPWTKALIDYARKHSDGPWLAFLEKKLHERLKEKEEVDRLSSEKLEETIEAHFA